MKKFLVISVIFFLIFFTAFIKNSTKRIDDLIFSSEENLRAFQRVGLLGQFEYVKRIADAASFPLLSMGLAVNCGEVDI